MKPEPTPASQRNAMPAPAATNFPPDPTRDPASVHPNEHADAIRLRQCLSALADGRADSLDEACRGWRDDAQARQTWHTYQLIGDVMRSDELACGPARNAAFLASFRQRLAVEPVVLAPEPEPMTAVAPVRRQRWVMPAAMAAGFVLVAGVLVVTRIGLPGGVDGASVGPALAGAPAGAGVGAGAVRLVDGSARPQVVPGPGSDTLLRNPVLDEYLRAHQSARAGVAVVAPGGTLRRVDAAVPAGQRQ